jgi:hypothetical protein
MSTKPAPSINDDLIIDTALAALLMSIPAKTLSKWRSTGEHNIPYIKIGRSVR